MKKRTLKCLLIILLMIPVSTLTAQEIGIQMGSMRKMYAEGMPAVIAKLKELGITEIEGGGGRSMDRASFRKLAEENGMKIIATGAATLIIFRTKTAYRKSSPTPKNSARKMLFVIGFRMMAIISPTRTCKKAWKFLMPQAKR